jgi:multidrug efflux pump subunit AcrA (membrane-fusion protein)
MRRIGLITIALAGVLFACSDDDYGTTPPPPPTPPVATVVTASGDIRTKVDEFRNALGPSNGTTVGEQATGRRESTGTERRTRSTTATTSRLTFSTRT